MSSAARRPKRISFHDKLKRHGYTLIEVLAVISLSAVLTGIIVAAMASLLRLDRRMTQHVEHRTELQRLSASIRSDLHQAIGFQWDAAEQTLVLEQTKQQSIRYQVIEGRWMRLADQEGNSTIYALTESFQCQCEPAKASQGARVRIRFTGIPDDEDDEDEQDIQMRPTLQCEIVATVGRDFDLLSE